MVGKRQFHAYDLIHKNNVLLHTACDGWGGISISPAQGIRADSFLLQGLGLSHQVFHASCHVIGSKKSQDSGDSCFNQGGQLYLRRPGAKASLSPAANNMLMLVNKSRNKQATPGIYLLTAISYLQMVSHRFYPASTYEYVLLSQVFRIVHFGLSYYYHDCSP